MNDGAKPQLALGTPPGKLKHMNAGSTTRWVWLFIVLQVVTLVLVVVALRRSETVGGGDSTTSSGENPRAVALSLEDRSLDLQAARAWQQYLQENPSASDRAEVLYRMGKLYFSDEQYGEAASALVRAEQAAGDDPALKDKIGLQLIACLRRLGRYGEVGRELSRQVEVGADDVRQGQVLATVAGEALTTADLDRIVERRLDQQLRMAGVEDDLATRLMLTKRYSGVNVRQQMLADLLRHELFTRRARELKIDQTDDFIRQRQVVEDDLLAGSFEQRVLAVIQPTRVDLESYFTANKEQYVEPESAEVVFFPLLADEQAEDLLKDVKSADEFRELAARRQKGDSEDAQELQTVTIVRGRKHPDLGATDPLFDIKPEAWTDEPHENGDQRYLVLIQSKTPARTPKFDEVAQRVEAEYRTRKRQEVLEHVFQELMTRYEVEIQPQAQELMMRHELEIQPQTPHGNSSPPGDSDDQPDE